IGANAPTVAISTQVDGFNGSVSVSASGPLSDTIYTITFGSALGTGNQPQITSGTITKIGLGTVILSGDNSYGGQTLVQQGVLEVNNPNALGANPNSLGAATTNTSNTIVAAGAALQLESSLQGEPVLINGNGIPFNNHNTGAIRSVANNNVYTGVLTMGTNTTIGVDSGSTLTIGTDPSGAVSGSGTINDQGSDFSIDKELVGTLVLATPNAIGGAITVDQGALRVEDANALGASGQFAGTTVLDGAQLQIARNAVTLTPTAIASEPLFLSGTGINATGALENVRGDTNPSGNNNNMWSGPITFNINPNFSPQTNPGTRVAIGVDDSGVPGVTDNLNINTNIQQDSTQGSFGLIKVGAGRLTLMKANSYTGTTEVGVNLGGSDIVGGSLRIQNSNSLGANTAASSVQTITITGLAGGLTYQLSLDGLTTASLSNSATAAQVQAALNALNAIGQSEQQQIVQSGTVGTYTLNFNGQVATLPFNAAASDIQNALNNLSSVRRSEVQDVEVVGTTGFFTLTFNGQTTVPLPIGVAASGGPFANSSVQNALNALTSIGPTGSVTVTSTTVGNSTTYHVTFGGSLANTNLPQLTAGPYSSTITQLGNGGATEVQTVAVFSTTGTFILTFNGQTT